MAIQHNAYLFFRGNCREAMEFYKDVFGGELNVQSYADVNASSEKTPADWLMHADLRGGIMPLMASDTAEASEKSAKISLSLSGDEEETLRTVFTKLSEDGSVFSELKKEAWGDIFGSLTDKFGIEWMVNISQKA